MIFLLIERNHRVFILTILKIFNTLHCINEIINILIFDCMELKKYFFVHFKCDKCYFREYL